MRIFKKQKPIAVRTIDLGLPLHALTDVCNYTNVQVFITWRGQSLGKIEIANHRHPISATRLREAIAEKLAMEVLGLGRELASSALWSSSLDALTRRYTPEQAEAPTSWLVDLSQPLRELTDVLDYQHVRVMVVWRGHHLGSVDIPNYRQPVSVSRLREAIANSLGVQLLKPGHDLGKDSVWANAVASLIQRYGVEAEGREQQLERLAPDIPVSIVIATLDRPADLRECLRSLVTQVSPRPIEIVVVDNNPTSGLTGPVVAEFPGVVLVQESRRGLAYARNAGFVASTGAIAIATDDDVIAPPDWLEKLVAPFARDDVMVVTGNVLPFELETKSQQMFELYGGLGRGFKRFEVNGDWFESFKFRAVPTWELGATANAAFRATIFSHPRIGLMHEALGPGMPSGVGEDTYVFYKVLKAGYTLVYEAEAYVWHKHRRDMAALRRQLFNYSKGGPAYHLTTFLEDGDLRGLMRLAVELPRAYKWRIKERLRGRSDYPLSLIVLEIWGNLLGFKGLWDSRRRVKREGASQPYLPVSQRPVLERMPPALTHGRRESLPARPYREPR
jgi:glycosyltransferase involved in cell wall biosynthesis